MLEKKGNLRILLVEFLLVVFPLLTKGILRVGLPSTSPAAVVQKVGQGPFPGLNDRHVQADTDPVLETLNDFCSPRFSQVYPDSNFFQNVNLYRECI